MWIAACIIVLVGGFALDRAFKAYRPAAYEVFANTVWTIEVVLFAVALVGGAYHVLFGGPVP
jgi:hypothetical protein